MALGSEEGRRYRGKSGKGRPEGNAEAPSEHSNQK